MHGEATSGRKSITAAGDTHFSAVWALTGKIQKRDLVTSRAQLNAEVDVPTALHLSGNGRAIFRERNVVSSYVHTNNIPCNEATADGATQARLFAIVPRKQTCPTVHHTTDIVGRIPVFTRAS